MKKQAKLKLWPQRHLTFPEGTTTRNSDVKHRKSQCYISMLYSPCFVLVVNTGEFKWGFAMLSNALFIKKKKYYAFKLYRDVINDIQLWIQYTKYINNRFNVTSWTFRIRLNEGFLTVDIFVRFARDVTVPPTQVDHCALLTLGVSVSSCLWWRLNGVKRQRAVVIRLPGDRFVREVGHWF